MAKSRNQTLKVLYLYDILRKHTDAQHPLSARALIEMLAANDVTAERKSIYDDIEALRRYGAVIECIPGRDGGFYLDQRMFEDVELQLLVDAVQASRFITDKKSDQLIRKLEQLTSKYAARRLHHQQPVLHRVKSMNESIYYLISLINDAMNDDRQISFRYFEYTADRKKRYRHGGQLYQVSPYALIWSNENYYLVAYVAAEAEIRHYRVDRMDRLNVTEAPRTGQEAFGKLDMSVYTRRMFNMFRGEEEVVHLRLPEHMAGVVMDTFGPDVPMMRGEGGCLIARVTVALSPQFYGWVFGLGSDAEITAPAHVRAAYRKLLETGAAHHTE
ncbi:MAG: WYL domain-containing transcriptional regulator [Clostridia bacterium]|nr:WYL domain-containing transcriptional regulator [Clostridia bacterium]